MVRLIFTAYFWTVEYCYFDIETMDSTKPYIIEIKLR